MTGTPNGSRTPFVWIAGTLVSALLLIAGIVVNGFATWMEKIDDRVVEMSQQQSRVDERVKAMQSTVEDVRDWLREEDRRRREELERHRFDER